MVRKKYALTVTASESYDKDLQIVPVNTETPVSVSTATADAQVCLRIRGFHGSKKHTNLSDSPYLAEHTDRNISILISLAPKVDIPGDDLIFGNDFGSSIKDHLPCGTSTGLKIFKWCVDPTVEGDLYSDKPYLYGKAVSSFNVINDTLGNLEETKCSTLEESIHADGQCVPAKSGKRMTYFQKKEAREAFTFQKGKTYQFDFFSGMLNLADSNVHIALPGFQINMTPYLSDGFRSVRYVLKKLEEPLLVLAFRLEEEVEGADQSDGEEELD